MTNFDIYNWPKNYVEDCFAQENDELENIFVDDYIMKDLDFYTSELEEHELEQLLSTVTKLASYFSRLRISVVEILGVKILNRLLDEADEEFESNLEQNSKNPFKKINSSQVTEEIRKQFEEEE